MQSASSIPSADMLNRKRLVAVLELIGSDKPGERQAAAEAAHRLVHGAGLRWGDVLAPQSETPADTPPPRRKAPTVRELVGTAARHRDQLSEWEREFVVSVGRQHRVTRKQYAILARIAGRVQS